MSTFQLELFEGRLCVVETDTDYNEPFYVKWYWPTCRGATDFREYDLSQATIHKWGAGGYGYTVKIPGLGFPLDLRLPDGGQTKALKVERIPYPKPKTRVETRWRNGKWEKYLKTRGWIAV